LWDQERDELGDQDITLLPDAVRDEAFTDTDDLFSFASSFEAEMLDSDDVNGLFFRPDWYHKIR
jgi:hypothetical protein